MPAISVVIPVHNGERFISEALQSALCQSFQDFEIIVIDDGSTDRSREIIGSFDGPITYRYQANRGTAAARNMGLSMAKGDWVAFLDADDVWYPHKLAVQMDHTRLHPEVDFFYSDTDIIDETGDIKERGLLGAKSLRRAKRNERSFISNGRRSLVSVVFNDQPFPYPSTVLAKRDMLLHAGGFNPLFTNYREDFEFFARMIRISAFKFIPQSLVKYRMHSPPKDRWRLHQNWCVLLQSLEELWRDEPEKQAVLRWQFAKHYARLTRERLSAWDLPTARSYFRQACGYRPSSLRGLWSWIILFRPRLSDLYNVYTNWRNRYPDSGNDASRDMCSSLEARDQTRQDPRSLT
jgi:glycosyltransferase involved in cell wall biosynthesis